LLALLPPPPPVEVIVVKPDPDIDEFEPLFPSDVELDPAPPSPTVTVITVLGDTDWVDVL